MRGLIKSFKADLLNVYVFNTREEMGVAACQIYRQRVLTMLTKQQRIRAIFAAAHSQDDFLAELVADKDIDFSRMEAFHMDEYLGLPGNAPQKFGRFLSNAIFDKKPFAKINLVQSDNDFAAECARYEALLRETPMDIVSMGIGENGHIAFNDPHEAKFDDPHWVRQANLDMLCRQQQVNDGEFATINDVPQRALTLTIPALMSCKSIVCVVPVDRKADAVRKTLLEPVSEGCPASVLRTHCDASLFVDKGAAKFIL